MPRITNETITVTPKDDEIDWRRRKKHTPSIGIRTTTIHADRSDSKTDPDERSHTLMKLGMGGRGQFVLDATATRLVEHGVTDVTIAEADPFWLFKSNEESLLRSTSYVMGAIATHLTHKYELATLHAVPESQGMVSTLEYKRLPNTLLNGRLGAIHPLGAAPDELDLTRFTSRMIETAAQSRSSFELAGIAVGANAAFRAFGDLAFTGGAQISAAGHYNGIPALRDIVEAGQEVAIFSGKDDRLIRANEIDYHLKLAGLSDDIQHEISSGYHAPPYTEAGIKLGVQACLFVQSGIVLHEEAVIERQAQFARAA